MNCTIKYIETALPNINLTEMVFKSVEYKLTRDVWLDKTIKDKDTTTNWKSILKKVVTFVLLCTCDKKPIILSLNYYDIILPRS